MFSLFYIAPKPVIGFNPSTTTLTGIPTTTAFEYSVRRTGNLENPSSVEWFVTGYGENPATPADFAGGEYPSGILNFAAGVTSQLLRVNLQDDEIAEPNEEFTVTLVNPFNANLGVATAFGTIVDNVPTLAISPGEVAIAEGDSGTTAFNFTVIRSGSSAQIENTSSVDWEVTGTGDNAASAADFVGGVFPSGTITFNRFITGVPITINVNGDTTVEADKQFTVTLSNPGNATIVIASAIGVIQNDD